MKDDAEEIFQRRQRSVEYLAQLKPGRKGDWMQAWPSGTPFWPLDPRPEECNLFDMVWALSLGTRYAAHLKRRYSVLEHQVRVCWLLRREGQPRSVQYQGLTHDMPEAYLPDLPRPIKRSMPFYTEAEMVIWRAISTQLDVEFEMHERVKHYDILICLTEKDHLCPTNLTWGITGVHPKMWFVGRLPPFVWRWLWMREFKRLAPRHVLVATGVQKVYA